MGPVGQPGAAVSMTLMLECDTSQQHFFCILNHKKLVYKKTVTMQNKNVHILWCRVLTESLDREDNRVILEQKVMKDPEDSPEHLVLLDFR